MITLHFHLQPQYKYELLHIMCGYQGDKAMTKNDTRVLSNYKHDVYTVQFTVLIVSITKFSIVIGSPRAYLSRNRRAITWVSDYRCPI